MNEEKKEPRKITDPVEVFEISCKQLEYKELTVEELNKVLSSIGDLSAHFKQQAKEQKKPLKEILLDFKDKAKDKCIDIKDSVKDKAHEVKDKREKKKEKKEKVRQFKKEIGY